MKRESLVMIPGTLCDERIFAQQAKYLKLDFNVILINYKDLRNLDDWPKQLLSCLPSNFSLIGFSLGGIWALEVLRQAPHRINRLVLIASNAEPANKANASRSKKMWMNWKTLGPKSVVEDVSKLYFHHHLLLNKHRPLLWDMAQKTNFKVAKKMFEWAAIRPASYATIADFKKPILIVSGEKDSLCSKNLQMKIAKKNPLAQWIELPRCGHFVSLEKPKKLTHILQNWLTKPTSQTEDQHVF